MADTVQSPLVRLVIAFAERRDRLDADVVRLLYRVADGEGEVERVREHGGCAVGDAHRETDGDNVRRYLGTVGVTSPLFKIRGGLKGVLKAKDLPDAFDAVAFAEASEQFLAELQDAEGDAYGRPRRRTCLLYAIAATSLALPVICHAGAQFADYSTSVGSGGQSPSATMLGKARKDVERARRSYAELLRLLAPLR